MTSRTRHVVFLGLMGSGKTTAAAALAEALGRRLSDSDEWIETACGATGREVAGRGGVDALHRLEADHLLDALASQEPLVVAAAASVVDDERCVAALEEALVVWLDPPVETLAERAVGGAHRRRLADAGETFALLHARRASAYARIADIVVTGVPSPQEIAACVVRST